MATTTTDRKSLQDALDTRVKAMDAVSDAFVIEDNGGVVVSEEKAADFRKNLAEAKEIRGILEDLDTISEMKAYGLNPGTPEFGGGSVAARMAALAAGAGEIVTGGQSGGSRKSIGQMFVESEEFAELKASGGYGMKAPWVYEGKDMASGGEQKDIYTASAPVQSTRGFGTTQFDPMVPMQFRTQRVRDLFPVANTSANLIDYFKVSGFTNNAAPVAERTAENGTAGNVVFGLKPQSSMTFVAAQAPVRTIAHWEAAHRNVLADEPQLQSTINNELLYGLRLQEDFQIIQGSGTGEDLTGILSTSGTQTYSQTNASGVATETKADALRRSATRVILAYFDPTGFVLHPYDWEDIELTKTTQGAYVLVTNVAVGAQKQVWQQPVVDTPACPEGTFISGAWGLGAQLYDREQANIRIAEQHADFFLRNAIVVLAEERLAMAVKRPESFVIGTFFG